MPPKSDPEAKAEEILRRFSVDEPPVPVERIVRHLGLKLEATGLGDDVSGVLVVQNGRGIIGVNSSHARQRQRFSIAHELGHFLLHSSNSRVFIDKGYFAAFRDSHSSTGQSKREREANAFAAALLMPKALVSGSVDRHQFDLADDGYVEKLANLFQVSKQAMTIRIVNLGLLSG
jgi:Zn-dependent peptidase ImmA (M78 family)